MKTKKQEIKDMSYDKAHALLTNIDIGLMVGIFLAFQLAKYLIERFGN